MAHSAESKKLRNEFVQSAQALFRTTKDATELYHLIHEVVHTPSQTPGLKTEKKTTDTIQKAKAEENTPAPTPKKRAVVTTIPLHPLMKTPPKSKPVVPSVEKVTAPVTPRPTAAKRGTAGRQRTFISQATPEANNSPEPDQMEMMLDEFFPKQDPASPSFTPSKKRTMSNAPKEESPLKKLKNITVTPSKKKVSTRTLGKKKN